MPNFSFSYDEYPKIDSLPEPNKLLVEAAAKSCSNAYAPYSNFKVGCAVLLNNGQIITGANVENASYPVGICAERTALSHVISNFPEAQIERIAVSYLSEKELNQIIFPCGMCRQFILECQTRNKKTIEIILHAPSNKCIIIENASDLIPFGFTGEIL